MRSLLALLAIATSLLVGCSNSDVEGDVLMTSSHKFEPIELTVGVGDSVVWANDSKEAHTVTAYQDAAPEGGYFASGGLDSEEAARSDVAAGLIDPGETFELRFDEPGTYEYFCIPHESNGMTGTITVE